MSAADELAVRPADWHADKAIELLLGTSVTAVDAGQRAVTLSTGRA